MTETCITQNTKVILKAGMLVREQGPCYTIHGTKLTFMKYGDDLQEALLKEGVLPNSIDWSKEAEKNHGLLHTETDGRVVREKKPSVEVSFGLYHENLY